MSQATARRWPLAPWFIAGVAVLGLASLILWRATRRPPDHWAEVEQARAYLGRGRDDLAFRTVAGIRDEAPGAAEALTIAARVLLMRGSVSPARKALERSLILRPDQAEAAKMLAAIYLASGDGQRGLSLLKRAARLDPRDFRPWYAMGKAYHDLGDLDKAADAYAQALDRSPPPAEARDARIGRIRALLDSKRVADAAEDIARARAAEPDDPKVLALAARQASDLGRRAEAEGLADRALAADPDSFDALLVRAGLRERSGRPKEALDDLERATRVNPNHLGALQQLIRVQSRLGMTDQARETNDQFRRLSDRLALMDKLTREIDRHPDDPEPRWRMGQVAIEGGLFTLARQCYQAALDIDPSYKPARESLMALRASERLGPDVGPRPPFPDGAGIAAPRP